MRRFNTLPQLFPRPRWPPLLDGGLIPRSLFPPRFCLHCPAACVESTRSAGCTVGPLPPCVVIEIAQEIGAAALTEVVRRHAGRSDRKHDRAGSHTQPGWVHVSLPIASAALARSMCPWALSVGSNRRRRGFPEHDGCRNGQAASRLQHVMQMSCHPGAIRAAPFPTCIAAMRVWARPSPGRAMLGDCQQAGRGTRQPFCCDRSSVV